MFRSCMMLSSLSPMSVSRSRCGLDCARHVHTILTTLYHMNYYAATGHAVKFFHSILIPTTWLMEIQIYCVPHIRNYVLRYKIWRPLWRWFPEGSHRCHRSHRLMSGRLELVESAADTSCGPFDREKTGQACPLSAYPSMCMYVWDDVIVTSLMII